MAKQIRTDGRMSATDGLGGTPDCNARTNSTTSSYPPLRRSSGSKLEECFSNSVCPSRQQCKEALCSRACEYARAKSLTEQIVRLFHHSGSGQDLESSARTILEAKRDHIPKSGKS